MRHHPLPFDTGEDEKILGPFSLTQTAWLGAGGLLAHQLAKIRLPLPGVFGYIHALIPFLPAAVMAFVLINNVPVPQYISLWYKCRRRKRVFRYKGVS